MKKSDRTLSLYQIITIFHGKTFNEATQLLEKLSDAVVRDGEFVKIKSPTPWSEEEYLMTGFELALNKFIVGKIRNEWILHPNADKIKWRVVKE